MLFRVISLYQSKYSRMKYRHKVLNCIRLFAFHSHRNSSVSTNDILYCYLIMCDSGYFLNGFQQIQHKTQFGINTSRRKVCLFYKITIRVQLQIVTYRYLLLLLSLVHMRYIFAIHARMTYAMTNMQALNLERHVSNFENI